jgi:pimeloyl-ACP methyl ester carboxylesterase
LQTGEPRKSALHHFIVLTVGVLVVGWMAASAALAQQRRAADDATTPPLKPCKLQGIEEELLCGRLSVFENRQSRSGRKIDLNVVVMPALEAGQKDAPLFNLEGGPGLAATAGAALYATALKTYRRHRDVVLVDQRGTGASNPLLCDEEKAAGYLHEMYPVSYVQACRRKLEQVADLTQYTTPIAMDDLDDIRQWLGYDKIDLIGLSYGTRAALVYMRQHPEHVRSVVLMGVAPTSAKLPLYHSSTAQRVMNLLLDECAADAACAQAFPRVREEFVALLDRLERQPARANYTLPATKKDLQVEIRRDIFAEVLRSQLYTPLGARRLPFIIHQAAQGDFTPFLRLAIHDAPSHDAPPAIADGMYLSVTCAEDLPFLDPQEAERLNKGTFFGNYRVVQQRRACQYWPRAGLPKNYGQAVVSSAPVLIYSGRMDPVTPAEWATATAAHLPNSLNVVITHHAHLPIGLTNLECFDKVILDFLTQASVKGLDTSCLGQMRPPPFFTGQPKAASSQK